MNRTAPNCFDLPHSLLRLCIYSLVFLCKYLAIHILSPQKSLFSRLSSFTAIDRPNSWSMGRAPCCDKDGLKKGPWTPEEDQKLVDYIKKEGYGNWRTLPKNAGTKTPDSPSVSLDSTWRSSSPCHDMLITKNHPLVGSYLFRETFMSLHAYRVKWYYTLCDVLGFFFFLLVTCCMVRAAKVRKELPA